MTTPDLSDLLPSTSLNTPLDTALNFLQADSDGVYAGTHLLIDICQAHNLDNDTIIQQMLTDCAKQAGATLIHLHTHIFSPNGGISGVAILAESHISIHTWPEINYASMDVFMCGNTQPTKTIAVIQQSLETDKISVSTHKRGQGLI